MTKEEFYKRWKEWQDRDIDKLCDNEKTKVNFSSFMLDVIKCQDPELLSDKEFLIVRETAKSQLGIFEEELLRTKIAGLRSAIEYLKEHLTELVENCPHSIITGEIGEEAKCFICKEPLGWRCENSPDGVCHYRTREQNGIHVVDLITEFAIHNMPPDYDNSHESEDECLFCGQPEKRL